MSNFEANIGAHDRVASKYKAIHTEIYNSIEQERIRAVLRGIVERARGEDGQRLNVLDFGSGDGNLTDAFAELDCSVVSADISKKLLNRIAERYPGGLVSTLLITEENKLELPASSVDIIGIYSVLHHVPDYLGLFEELRRVLRPGGYIYIDHENSLSFWSLSDQDARDYQKFRGHQKKGLRRFLNPFNYIDYMMRKFIDSKYQREGDIHVWPDDHIEWSLIQDEVKHWATVETYEEYLVFREGYDEHKYELACENLNDCAYMIIRKTV